MSLLVLMLCFIGIQYLATISGYGKWPAIIASSASLPLSLAVVQGTGSWLAIAGIVIYCNTLAAIFYLLHRMILKHVS